MPNTLPAPTRTSVDSQDLVPGPGVEQLNETSWSITQPQIRLNSPGQLDPGWYEVRIAARSSDRFTVRKRMELTFDSGDANPRSVGRDAFAWNREFEESFMLRLTRPASGLRLDVWHAEGELTFSEFRVRKVSSPSALARAVSAKIRLTRAYRCFGPAMYRGSRLLLHGRLSEFGNKLYKGLTDARVMQLGMVADAELDGAWARRYALSTEDADRYRRAIDCMSDPPPITIILPVDPKKLDVARQSAHSIRRQLYPHWQLIFAVAGPSDIELTLEHLIGRDPRVQVARVSRREGFALALAKAIGLAECESILVLPPTIELADHALVQIAQTLQAEPELDAIGCRVYEGSNLSTDPGWNSVWLTRSKKLSDEMPEDLSVKSLAVWVNSRIPTERRKILNPVLAYPPDDRPLMDRTRVGEAPQESTRRLILGADLRGISGYDQVTFTLLKGLPTAGADVRMHPGAAVRADLIPPGLVRPIARRRTSDSMLILGPPFLVGRFGPDKQSAIYTMWEADRINPDWVPWLNMARMVLVPSRWQVECFRNCGVTVPMAVAPLGYDPVVFHPSGSFPEVCTFGTAGALSSGGVRKNAQWVIDLFRKAFPTEQNVRLRVKISPASPGVETYDDPRIDVIRAVLPLIELADWYRSLTVYLNGSSGEGFGLHLIESMACGRALISTRFSGVTEYFDDSVGYVASHRLVTIRNEIYDGQMAEPDEHSMIEQMHRVYRDSREAQRFGSASASRAKRFTWKAGGQAVAKALREHDLI